MDSGLNGEERPRPTVWGYIKFVALFLGIIVVVFGGYIGWRVYQLRQADKRLGEFVNALNKADQEDYKQAMADTYGGKTPQETLQLYIDAVEKGDYSLASKYFIGVYQDKWQKELEDIKNQNKIQSFLAPIKQSLQSAGEYSVDGKSFSIYKPIQINFKLYPNGVWKIIEI